MDLAGRAAAAFTCAMAFSDNGDPAGLHGNPYPRDIDGNKCAAVLPCEHAAGLDRFPIPAIKAKDPVGFRDRVPALDIGELAAVGLARSDLAGVEIAPQRLYLLC